MPARLASTPEEIDCALSLGRGYRGAAAKLLGLSARQLRNAIAYRPFLKQRWGKRVGRPIERLGFRIDLPEGLHYVARRDRTRLFFAKFNEELARRRETADQPFEEN